MLPAGPAVLPLLAQSFSVLAGFTLPGPLYCPVLPEQSMVSGPSHICCWELSGEQSPEQGRGGQSAGPTPRARSAGTCHWAAWPLFHGCLLHVPILSCCPHGLDTPPFVLFTTGSFICFDSQLEGHLLRRALPDGHELCPLNSSLHPCSLHP